MTMSDAAPTGAPLAATPRRAATLVLLRDGARGMEVLLLRRAERAGDRSSGAHVFAGGTLDAADADPETRGCVGGLDDAAASARLGLERGGLDYYVAALRECFEEAGVLIACGPDPAAGAVASLRRRLRLGEIGLPEVCRALGVRLAADRLVYYSHWLTPRGLPKRFDTRFFVAEMPPGQAVLHDNEEIQSHCWMRPADALDPASGLLLPAPT